MTGMALALAGSMACTEIIEIELDSTYQRLVVYGTVTDDSLRHEVKLSLSSDYFSNVPSPRISGANVEVVSGNYIYRLNEHDTIPGLYVTEEAFRGVPGQQYLLHISQVDINNDGIDETYGAESRLATGARLDSIKVNYFQSPFGNGYQVLMYALDPPERNWYSFKLWKNQDLLTDELSKYSVQTDDFFNGSYIYGLPVGFLSDDDPIEAVGPGDTVTFELNTIDQQFYDFISDAQLEIIGNNPLFSGPPANISSNIKEGGQGIFAAYSVQKVALIIPEEQP
jgi:hypothetical protein